MRRFQLVHVLCVAGFIFLSNGTARAGEAPSDLSGKYRCEGNDFNGDKYSGEVTITKNGDTYLLQWDVTFERAGRAKYAGVGLVMDGILSASWEGQTKAGVIAYKVGKTGALSGRWTISGNKGTMTEQLTPLKR